MRIWISKSYTKDGMAHLTVLNQQDALMLLAKALHRHDPAIQSLAKQHGEGNVGREKAIVAKAWERNEGGARDFYLKLAADVIADMEKDDV